MSGKVTEKQIVKRMLEQGRLYETSGYPGRAGTPIALFIPNEIIVDPAVFQGMRNSGVIQMYGWTQLRTFFQGKPVEHAALEFTLSDTVKDSWLSAQLLKTGDVFDLEEGMEVNIPVLERFIYENRPLSGEFANHVVTVGDVLTVPGKTSPSDVIPYVAKAVAKAIQTQCGLVIAENGIAGFLKPYAELAESALPKSYDTSELIGEYLVVKTEMSGGGTGHGQHDTYPDGHHVTALKLKDGKYDPEGQRVTFYQTGCFSGKIVRGEAIAKRKMQMMFQ